VKKALLVTLALWATLVSGCGSICNVTSCDLYPYGGLEQDYKWMNSSTANPMNGKPYMNSDGYPDNSGRQVLGEMFRCVVIAPIEVSLTAVCDTAMLPVTLGLNPHDLPDFFDKDD
jgi:uncharacterized protein YceK